MPYCTSSSVKRPTHATRDKSCGPAQADDIAARLAVLDHFNAHGLTSELTVHVLFEPLGWCRCTRCAEVTP